MQTAMRGVAWLRFGAAPVRPACSSEIVGISVRIRRLPPCSFSSRTSSTVCGGVEGADDLAVDPDLGCVVAGAVALAEVQAELVVGGVLTQLQPSRLSRISP